MELLDENVVEEGRFDLSEYADELARAPGNHEIGTTLWFENDHVRIFEIRLEPGERAPFHVHDRTYFWTVVEPGRGMQRRSASSSRARMRGGGARWRAKPRR